MIGIIGDFIVLFINKLFHKHRWVQDGEENIIYLAHTDKTVVKRTETTYRCPMCGRRKTDVVPNPNYTLDKELYKARPRV